MKKKKHVEQVVRTKKELVQMLLKNKVLDEKDEEELMDLLVDQPISIDVDKLEDESMTLGDRVADKVSEVAGSWFFIIMFIFFLIFWIVLNTLILRDNAPDSYPFILLNLLLSCIAAIQAPIIMMSQNRQSKKESLRSYNNYRIDLKSELILEELHDKLDKMLKQQREILNYIEEQENNKDKN